ncbi:Putative polyol transporter 2, partial [Linum grandiflorum]
MLSAATISIDLNLTDQHHNEIVNIARKACIASAIVTGFTLNYLGRMGIIVLGLFIHAIGVLFTCLGSAYQVVKTGRILMGLSFGIGMTAGPIYVAEIAPAAHRGLLISLSQLLLTTGEVFGYVGRYLAEAHLVPHYSWRAVLVIGIIPSFFIAAFLPFFFAESPC